LRRRDSDLVGREEEERHEHVGATRYPHDVLRAARVDGKEERCDERAQWRARPAPREPGSKRRRTRVKEDVREMERPRPPACEVPVHDVARAHERAIKFRRRVSDGALRRVPEIGREAASEVSEVVRVRILCDERMVVEHEAVENAR
jgi:hypothetical protein